jgi:hypothetical protein
LAKGKYRVAFTQNGAHPTATRSNGQPGLRERVEGVLGEHPDWNRRQVTDELIQAGWDFGSKQPIFAVNACFASLARDPRA